MVDLDRLERAATQLGTAGYVEDQLRGESESVCFGSTSDGGFDFAVGGQEAESLSRMHIRWGLFRVNPDLMDPGVRSAKILLNWMASTFNPMRYVFLPRLRMRVMLARRSILAL